MVIFFVGFVPAGPWIQPTRHPLTCGFDGKPLPTWNGSQVRAEWFRSIILTIGLGCSCQGHLSRTDPWTGCWISHAWDHSRCHRWCNPAASWWEPGVTSRYHHGHTSQVCGCWFQWWIPRVDTYHELRAILSPKLHTNKYNRIKLDILSSLNEICEQISAGDGSE